ncbi:CLUMA_CG002773, isoform A [Clunio marinus]|uniref:CLUMA_CG002773, isoform A n=1 Tax=Clunio marinus TaxID=568069 RepID=A0A1J1HN99_9DIPT|nr:CLUMA_CG002773, isoform A [Clunio marinus]
MCESFAVPGKKSSLNARKFLNLGRSKLKKLKYFEALENLNKSLCYAEEGSKEMIEAYANRSEVYFMIKEYEKCLENINLAIKCGCDASVNEVLKLREAKCNELLKDDNSQVFNPWSFFKLSYPPHEKLPYVANCIELKQHELFGRYLVTTRNLTPGDIIAIEEPFFKIVHTSSTHLRCSNCLKANKLDLIPSRLTSSGMFCSEQCQTMATGNFHNVEVDLRSIEFAQKILLESLNICDQNVDKLKALIEDPKQSSQTVFDFDWSDKENGKFKMHGLLAFNSLQLGPITDDLDYIETHPVLDYFEYEHDREIAKAYLIRIARILSVNCYSLDWWSPKREDDDNLLFSSNKMKIGSAMLPFGSLFNHSCAPSIDRMIVDNKFVFIVRRSVCKGEQLFISYGPSFIREPNDFRQMNLKAHFDFSCSCEACVANFPIAFSHPLSREVLTIKDGPITSNDEWKWKEELKKNYQAIEGNHTKFPSLSLWKIMDRNLYLLAAIARNEPFVF